MGFFFLNYSYSFIPPDSWASLWINTANFLINCWESFWTVLMRITLTMYGEQLMITGWTSHTFSGWNMINTKALYPIEARSVILSDTVESGILLLSSLWGQQWKWTEFRQMGPKGMKQGKEMKNMRMGIIETKTCWLHWLESQTNVKTSTGYTGGTDMKHY